MNYSADEMMTVQAARALPNDAVCFVGIGLPSAAANLARLTDAPNTVLIYESGTIGAKPTVLPLSIGDGELSATADTVVNVPEMFRYWLQGGKIDVGFLGGAQIDKYANLNTTVIGDYDQPKVRLPGAGGAPEISTQAKDVLIVMKQGPRSFVDRLDFITSPGHLNGGTSRIDAGIKTAGPSKVITDLCIMQPHPDTKELTVVEMYPGVTREQVIENTGWAIRFADEVRVSVPPSDHQLAVLRDLHARTARAHAGTQHELYSCCVLVASTFWCGGSLGGRQRARRIGLEARVVYCNGARSLISTGHCGELR